MLRAASRRAYWGTQAWQDQALAAKRNASSTQMVSLATLQSLYSFRPGIAYVLDSLYLAPTARSPARPREGALWVAHVLCALQTRLGCA